MTEGTKKKEWIDTVALRRRFLRLPGLFVRSLQLRMVLVFLLLAVALVMFFWTGAQRTFAVGWREAARPLLMDYVDRLVADVVIDGSPRIGRAQALVRRLPVTLDIRGPRVNWSSHPDAHSHACLGGSAAGAPGGRGGAIRSSEGSQPLPADIANRAVPDGEGGSDPRPRSASGFAVTDSSAMAGSSCSDVRTVDSGSGTGGWETDFCRLTADGHVLIFGVDAQQVFGRNPARPLIGLTVLLSLTLLAWLYVRRSLKPLAAIEAGARRFGRGDFSEPIPERHAGKSDELGTLARTFNTMGKDIEQMLESKRALLLAISHELRSPLTRARLHTELLPESDDVRPQRDALMRDLQEMSRLISDLLESERLAGRHAALQREPVNLVELVAEVRQGLQTSVKGNVPDRAGGACAAQADSVSIRIEGNLPGLRLDAARIRLLVRNLLSNALRHGAAERGPELLLAATQDGGVSIEVRDFGPGVPDESLEHLAQPFFRPDSARTRRAGGIGLGLYLCRLVAEAHGGRFAVSNARPGLRIRVTLPADAEC
ncbi:MAG: ATP-binding protein [Lautropia sp.]|nr:ATP-binding protein [Lautropia sp.]